MIFAGVVGVLALLSGSAAFVLQGSSAGQPIPEAARPGQARDAGPAGAWAPQSGFPVSPSIVARTAAPAPLSGGPVVAAAVPVPRGAVAAVAEPAPKSVDMSSGRGASGGSWTQGLSVYGDQAGSAALSSSVGALASLFAGAGPAGIVAGTAKSTDGAGAAPTSPSAPAAGGSPAGQGAGAGSTSGGDPATGSTGTPASSLPAPVETASALPPLIGSSGAGTPAATTTPTAPAGGGPALGTTPQNPFVPKGTVANGSYLLPVGSCVDSTCPSNGWQFFDPEIAVGFDYALVPTNGNTSLTYGITDIQVSTIVGDGVYQLYLCDAGDPQCDVATGVNLVANGGDTSEDIFDLAAYLETLSPAEDAALGISDPALGASRFAIRGIDPSAGLDPDNPEDFVVGLLFAGTVDGELVITPEVVDPPAPVPEPPGWSILIPALLLALAARRKRRDATT